MSTDPLASASASDWSTSSDETTPDSDSDSSPDHFEDPSESLPPPTQSAGQLFASPAIQAAIHTMLTHLQAWWQESEHLLQLMADKKLPCDTLMKLSDQIDSMLDKAIEKLITSAATDPSVFPIQELVGTSRTVKKYVFLKVGEVCCQQGMQDECAEAANKALVSLKKVRNAGADTYDEMIAHLLTSTQEDTMSTPELEDLLSALTIPKVSASKRYAARGGAA